MRNALPYRFTSRVTSSFLALALCSATAFAADTPTIEGTLTNKHEIELANNDQDPSAQTFGEFMRDYPRGAPTRMRMFPTKQAMELTVNTPDGKRIKVVQDKEDSDGLEVGDRVMIDNVEGKQKVLAVK